VKKILVLAVLFWVVAAVNLPAAWAENDPQGLTEKEEGDIRSTAKAYFPKQWVSFYKNRVFVRDAEGYVVTFEVLPVERKVREIRIRPGYENFAFMFFVQVSDFINCPSQAPSAFGRGVIIKKN
jgi:hypothetical protein